MIHRMEPQKALQPCLACEGVTSGKMGKSAIAEENAEDLDVGCKDNQILTAKRVPGLEDSFREVARYRSHEDTERSARQNIWSNSEMAEQFQWSDLSSNTNDLVFGDRGREVESSVFTKSKPGCSHFLSSTCCVYNRSIHVQGLVDSVNPELCEYKHASMSPILLKLSAQSESVRKASHEEDGKRNMETSLSKFQIVFCRNHRHCSFFGMWVRRASTYPTWYSHGEDGKRSTGPAS